MDFLPPECPVCWSRTRCPSCGGSGVVTTEVVVGAPVGGVYPTDHRLDACGVCCTTGIFHDLGIHKSRGF